MLRDLVDLYLMSILGLQKAVDSYTDSFPSKFFKSESNSSTFSAMTVFLMSVMWNVDSSPWLFFISTEFPFMLITLKSSLKHGWNDFDV